jgi:hypothetical protein
MNQLLFGLIDVFFVNTHLTKARNNTHEDDENSKSYEAFSWMFHSIFAVMVYL